MSSRRPRRSRIYDSNYNIGENYYKSAIDRLDEKYHSRPASSVLLRHSEPPAVSPPRPRVVNLDADDLAEEDLEFSRDRASRAIQKETILDQRSGRRGLELESSFDGQVQKTLDRIQASKKLLNTIDLDEGYSKQQSSNLASSKLVKRSVKVVSDISSSAQKSSNDLTKWSKNTDYNDSESFAAVRARQSQARLQDIEQDMFERNLRQNQRQERMSNVKKLLAESGDLEDSSLVNGVSSLKITKSTKRVTTY